MSIPASTQFFYRAIKFYGDSFTYLFSCHKYINQQKQEHVHVYSFFWNEQKRIQCYHDEEVDSGLVRILHDVCQQRDQGLALHHTPDDVTNTHLHVYLTVPGISVYTCELNNCINTHIIKKNKNEVLL